MSKKVGVKSRMLNFLLKIYAGLTYRGYTKWVPDETHLKLMYRQATGEWPDLKNPKTFGEKLQWMKLNDHNPLYPILADKVRSKQWASSIIGECYLPKVLATWESADSIDISNLPDKFVLKTNHDSSGVIPCTDKSVFNLSEAKKRLQSQLDTDYYWLGREWPYHEIPRLAFAEEFLEDTSGDLPDYKILCFGGEPELVEVHKNRFNNHTQDLYSPSWQYLDIKWDISTSGQVDPKPGCWDLIIELTKRLSEGLRHVRVDWYIVNGRPLLGELTLFDGSGFELFLDREYDEYLGSLIRVDKDIQ